MEWISMPKEHLDAICSELDRMGSALILAKTEEDKEFIKDRIIYLQDHLLPRLKQEVEMPPRISDIRF